MNASGYRPVPLLKLLDALRENFYVSDKDGDPPGIILVIEHKEQRYGLL